jgi:alpha-tubulin suppressor-like RCC1 family protein
MDAGALHTCAVLRGGAVRCWGSNVDGQVGSGSGDMAERQPVSVLGLTDAATDVVCGEVHTCALLASGEVMCWGDNSVGQIGDGSMLPSPTAERVLDLPARVLEIAAGGAFNCALLDGGSVRCWGSNSSGQLGDGTTTSRPRPVAVVGLPGPATSIAAGGAHACALVADAAYCWGAGSQGQLGDGTRIARSMPTTAAAIAAAAAIDAGGAHTCARLVDGAVRCWGYNSDGQLGDETVVERDLPVAVVPLR